MMASPERLAVYEVFRTFPTDWLTTDDVAELG